jgi:1-carboxybiuret hydrolase subunit AtzG-like
VDESLDQYIEAAAKVLDLPIEPDWLPAIKANLEVTLRLGKDVASLALPDAVEPAFVFEA